MRAIKWRLAKVMLWSGLGLAALPFAGHDAQAQSVFCPGTVATNVGAQTGFNLTGGACTNGTIGAFSNAALAAQALSDVSQSASLQSTQVSLEAISARRRVEIERCPDGLVRIAGTCQRPPGAAPTVSEPTPAPAPGPRRTARHRATRPAPRPALAPAPVYKAPVYKAPVAAIESGVRFATWTRAFGDFEKRTGGGSTTINCCQALGGGGIPNTLALSSTSRNTTWGVLGGADLTFRGIGSANDGLIAGLLVGYVSSDVQLTTTSTSGTPANVGNGAATLNAHLRGPTVGGYLTYFNGGFSADLTFKVDFLTTDVDFTDTLAYTLNVGGGGPIITPATSFSGSGSTSLNNYTTVGNVNYRFPLSGAVWMEPTAGFQYTASVYNSGAAALGLADGEVWRLQGGSRFGIDFYSGTTRITPVLTALAYDDVSVTGGFVSGSVFTNVPVALSDQGKLRGEGILTLNVDNGRGFSAFIEGEVRGGQDLIGYGGKGGIRYQWGS
jgi:hypothetical protein